MIMKREEKSIPEIFQNQVKKYAERACVSYKNRDGVYTDISWNDMNRMIHSTALFLASEGVEKGDMVSIFSKNRYEWWVTDQAILILGAVNVPVYPTNSAEETEYILDHSGAKICFADTEENLKKVLQVKDNLNELKTIIAFDDIAGDSSGFISFNDSLKRVMIILINRLLKKGLTQFNRKI